VLVADAQKVKGLAPLACKTDKLDARVLAELSWRELVPAIWLPDPSIRRERELARYRLPSGPASHDAQEPHPRDADDLRAPRARSRICSANAGRELLTAQALTAALVDVDLAAPVTQRLRRDTELTREHGHRLAAALEQLDRLPAELQRIRRRHDH
jgi:hypothetical protein